LLKSERRRYLCLILGEAKNPLLGLISNSKKAGSSLRNEVRTSGSSDFFNILLRAATFARADRLRARR
jgi:hypothetical protein